MGFRLKGLGLKIVSYGVFRISVSGISVEKGKAVFRVYGKDLGF